MKDPQLPTVAAIAVVITALVSLQFNGPPVADFLFTILTATAVLLGAISIAELIRLRHTIRQDLHQLTNRGRS